MLKEQDHKSFKAARVYPAPQQHYQVQNNSPRRWTIVEPDKYSNNHALEAAPHMNGNPSSSTQPVLSKTQSNEKQPNVIHLNNRRNYQKNNPFVASQPMPLSPSSLQPDYFPTNHRLSPKISGKTDTSNGNSPNLPLIKDTDIPKKPKPAWIYLALILGLAIAAIVVLTVLFITKQNPTSTSSSSNSVQQLTCGTNCMMSLTAYRSPTIASWPFSNNLLDTNNIYTGAYTPSATPTYAIGNIDQSVYFDSAHYVSVQTSFLNFSYQSWTIEGWILINDVSVDRGLFTQCASPTTTDQCLDIGIKSKRLYFSFYNDYIMGATFLTATANKWYHIAFVYDYSLMQQYIYLNGVLDGTTWGSARLAGPYQGTSGYVYIGRMSSGSYFWGYMERLQISSGAKTSCQILNDATLTAYYPFDYGTLNLDLSINYISGYSNSSIVASGRVNQASLFQGTLSYFYSTAFTAYSTSESFSVALWVKPYSVFGGTLIHLSTSVNGAGTACFDLLGFSTTGQLIANIYYRYTCCSLYSSISIGGPVMQINTWTHIVLTYSSTNGMTLYTNGTMRVFNDAFSTFPSVAGVFTTRPYMIVGSPTTTGALPAGCLVAAPAVSPAPYQGLIDELRIYSRELTITEICSLFNP